MPANDILERIRQRNESDLKRNAARKTKSGKTLQEATNSTNRSSIVYHDDLVLRLQAAREANKNIKNIIAKERGLSNVSFEHHLNSPISPTISTALVMDSSNIQEGENNLVGQIRNFFWTEYINPIKKYEDDEFKKRQKILPDFFRSKIDMLNFYNDKSSNVIPDLSLVEFFDEVFKSHKAFAYSGQSNSDFTALTNALDKVFKEDKYGNPSDTLLNMIKEGLETSDRFWGFIQWLMVSDKEKLKSQIYTTKMVEQLNKSGRTVVELLEKINLMYKYQTLAKDYPNRVESVEVHTTGGTYSLGFLEWKSKGLAKAMIEKKEAKVSFTDYFNDKISQKSMSSYGSGIYSSSSDNPAFDKKLIELQLKKELSLEDQFLVKLIQEEKSKSIPNVNSNTKADLVVVIRLKNPTEVITDRIDAKFGSGNTFKRAEKFEGTIGNFLMQSQFTPKSEFEDYLKLLVAHIAISGILQQNKDVIKKEMTAFYRFGIYLSITTELFREYFKLTEKDYQAGVTSNLVVIRDKYMWLSDFLIGLDDFYFIRKIPQKQKFGYKGSDTFISTVTNKLTTQFQNQTFNFKDLKAAVKDPVVKQLIDDTIKDIQLIKILYQVDVFDLKY